MSGDELHWVSSDGAPLLLLPGEHLSSWGGVEPPADGQPIKAIFRWGHLDNVTTDYDRACDVEGYLGMLEIGTGHGLVLGDEPDTTAWQSFVASEDEDVNAGGILIRCEYTNSDNDADIIAAVEQVPATAWVDDGLVLSVGHEPLYLLDAAYDASMLDGNDHLTIHLPAGTYSIATAKYEQIDHMRLRLHRLMRFTTAYGADSE